MSALSLCVEFITSGQILGQGLDSTPDSWDAALGDPEWPLIDIDRRRMRRDFGLVELAFERRAADWTCVHIAVQAHRLRGELELLIPPGIDRKYGPIETAIVYSDVLEAVSSRGFRAKLIPDRDTAMYSRYWFEENGIIVAVQGPGNESPGSLWAIGMARDATNSSLAR